MTKALLALLLLASLAASEARAETVYVARFEGEVKRVGERDALFGCSYEASIRFSPKDGAIVRYGSGEELRGSRTPRKQRIEFKGCPNHPDEGITFDASETHVFYQRVAALSYLVVSASGGGQQLHMSDSADPQQLTTEVAAQIPPTGARGNSYDSYFELEGATERHSGFLSIRSFEVTRIDED